MPYPDARSDHVERFQRDGYLVVRDAVDPSDLERLVAATDRILANNDQFLAKPPGASARTPWHQDEAYWGRNLDERGITCWMPFHDVDESDGCMHFVPGAHRQGIRPHRAAEGVQSDLLSCPVDEAAAVACPLFLGDVTFHHGKMPHMTPANVSDHWRRALTQHFRVAGSDGEGDHYPWKVYVNQASGERIRPVAR